MNKKMSLMGVGGKIAIVLVISTLITETISVLSGSTFRLTNNYDDLVPVAIVLAIVGFAINLIAAFGMIGAYNKDELATKGLYSIFLNPMYTFQIFITVPGLLLLLNSWLVLITVIPTFIAFKIFVKEEQQYLENKFGKKYADYKNKVLIKFL